MKVLKRNSVLGFKSIKLINSNRQPPNLKKLLAKVEFSKEEVGVKIAKICDANVASHFYYPKNIKTLK